MAIATPPSPKDQTSPEPSGGVIREAKRRRRLRLLLRFAAVACVLFGVAAGGALLLAGGGSGSATGHRGATGGVDPKGAFAVRLSPSLDGGTSGWCVGLLEGSGEIAGGGCGALPVRSRPIVTVLSTASANARTNSVVVLTTPAVGSLLVNGSRRVPTGVVAGLPYGLRGARVVLPLHVKRSPSGRLVFAAPVEPSLVALAADGRRLADPAPRPRPGPAVTASGPCTLTAPGLPGAREQWSHLAAPVRPYPEQLVGRAFFSCVDVEYYLHGWPLDAAVLLDAAHPGSLPAAIPGLTAVAGHRGYVNGPGDFKGELTATRRGSAWLVVAGGNGLAQRLRLLSHLKATISLPRA